MSYDPDSFLVSLVQSFQEYVEGEIHNFVRDNLGNAVGSAVYDVVMEHPASGEGEFEMPLDKTVIHFEIDHIDNRRLGIGPQMVNADYPLPAPGDAQTVIEWEAFQHEVSFDVGIWASDLSGGVTSRLTAYQMLDYIVNGDTARTRCSEATEGVEIRSYTDGRLVKETVADIRVYRMVGAELVVRVYSRRKAATENVVDMEPIQAPELVIDENVNVIDD